MSEREIEADRQMDRQRQRERERDRGDEIESDRHRNRHAYKQTGGRKQRGRKFELGPADSGMAPDSENEQPAHSRIVYGKGTI